MAVPLLASRALLHERLEQALAAADRHRRPLVLVFLDLDGFEPINDRLGHAADVGWVAVRGCDLHKRR